MNRVSDLAAEWVRRARTDAAPARSRREKCTVDIQHYPASVRAFLSTCPDVEVAGGAATLVMEVLFCCSGGEAAGAAAAGAGEAGEAGAGVVVRFRSFRRPADPFPARDVCAWIRMMRAHDASSSAAPVEINLVLCPVPKAAPPAGAAPPAADWINSGLTAWGGRRRSVHVFREEEWFKVFVHETLHCFGQRHPHAGAAAVNAELLDRYRGIARGLDLRAVEAVTEFWAELVVLAMRGAKGVGGGAGLQQQVQFSRRQSARLLALQGFHSLAAVRAPRTPPYTERTAAFAYFVLKTQLLEHAQELVEAVEGDEDGMGLIAAAPWDTLGPAARVWRRHLGDPDDDPNDDDGPPAPNNMRMIVSTDGD